MKKIFLPVILFTIFMQAFSQTVTPDTSFAGKGWTYVDFAKTNFATQYATQVLLQSDNASIVVIQVSRFIVLARYFSNGSLDLSFGTNGFSQPVFTYSYNLQAVKAALQSNGKIIVTGDIRSDVRLARLAPQPFTAGFAITRFNSNGTIDNSFGDQGTQRISLGREGEIACLAVQADDKIVAAGSLYNTETGTSDFAIVRFKPDGAMDNSFGKKGIIKMDFGIDDMATGIAVQKDGKIIMAGNYYDQSQLQFILIRFNKNGSLDDSFDKDGISIFGSYGDQAGSSIVIQTDGKILVTGGPTTISFPGDFMFTRIDTDGKPDSSFGSQGTVTTDFGGIEYATFLVLQSDNKIVVSGYSASTSFANVDFALARYNEDGSLDNSFDDDGKQTTDIGGLDLAVSLSLLADNRILVAGISLDRTFFSADFALARYNQDGSLDKSFATNGILKSSYPIGVSIVNAMALQTDGKIVLAGNTGNFGILGTVPSVLAAPADQDVALARINHNGLPDSSFGAGGAINFDWGGDDYANDVAIQNDGKIIITGYSLNYDDYTLHGVLARYQPNGAVDSSFGMNGLVRTDFGDQDYAYSIRIQPDGKLVIAGSSYDSSTESVDLVLARYNMDGTPDVSFDGDGKVKTDFMNGVDYASALAIQSDGKIVISAVTYDSTFEIPKLALARFNTNGSPDNSFDADGKLITNIIGRQGIKTLLIQKDGKLVVTGFNINYFKQRQDLVIARYNSDGSIDYSFDGDGMQTTTLFSGERYGVAAPGRYNFTPAIDMQSNGRIILGVTVYDTTGGDYDFSLVRYNTDGSADASFGSNGELITDIGQMDMLGSIAVSGNRIYMAGSDQYAIRTGILAAFHINCINKEICGNREDDNCDGQVDEGCNASPFININSPTVDESAGKAVLTVSLSRIASEPVSVHYFTMDKTATGKTGNNIQQDYQPKEGMVTIPAGKQTATISINIINDSIQEPDEYFEVRLYHPVRAAIGNEKAQVTIQDDDVEVGIPVVANKKVSKEQAQVPALSARVQPNPSSGFFNLEVESSNNQPVNVQLTDAVGRLVESRKEQLPNTTIQMGNSLKPGIYYAEVQQGRETVKLKLVKQ